jgi:hypothetical protein
MDKSQELAIISKLEKIPNKLGTEKLEKIKNIQLKFLANSISNKNNNLALTFRDVVQEIFSITALSANITQTLNPSNGLLVISNHLGINKLTKIYPSELKPLIIASSSNIDAIPRLENDDPFVLLLAPIVQALSKALENFERVEIIFVCMEFADIYSSILRNINAVLINRSQSDQYNFLHSQLSVKINNIKRRMKIPIIVIFPEGGTSGKYNDSEPYSLLRFKDGYRHISKSFDMPILPIAISVDSEINYFANFGDFLTLKQSITFHRQALQSLLNLDYVEC